MPRYRHRQYPAPAQSAVKDRSMPPSGTCVAAPTADPTHRYVQSETQAWSVTHTQAGNISPLSSRLSPAPGQGRGLSTEGEGTCLIARTLFELAKRPMVGQVV